MIVLDLEQGSEAWLQARRTYRNASETSAIMGIKGAFSSANDIRKAKRGINQADNVAMRHGRDFEEKARQVYIEKYGFIKPVVGVSGDYLASLDGIDDDGEIIAEIKVPFKGKDSKLWVEAAGGMTVPAHYEIQVQHQLMVSKAKLARFFVWDANSGDYVTIEVLPDPAKWEKICTAWDAFWLTLNEREDEEWAAAAQEFSEAYKAASEATERLELVKKRLRDMAQDKTTFGAGIMVNRIEKTGSVDWKKVQSDLLPEIDLKPYRKASTIEMRVSLSENKE